ncbi:MAG: thioredoxin family protein [Phycisphaerales bacterium JB040]
MNPIRLTALALLASPASSATPSVPTTPTTQPPTLARPEPDAPESPWSDRSIDEAMETASTPVLVYFGPPWCLACHRMNATTWTDPRVREALAGYLPVKASEDELAASERWDVHGYPTVVIFKDGREIARNTGFRDAASMHAWLRDPGSPKGVPREPSLGDLHDRAMDLLIDGRDAEASARALVRVWVRAGTEDDTTPTLRWLRRDRYPSMLARIAQDPYGRAVVESLLEGFGPEGPALDADPRLIADWLVIQQALAHDDAIGRWVDRALVEPEGVTALRAQPGAFWWLEERGRLPEAGRIASERLWDRWIARHRGAPTGDPVSDAAPAGIVQKERDQAADRLDRIARCLREAGRTEDAERLESAKSG